MLLSLLLIILIGTVVAGFVMPSMKKMVPLFITFISGAMLILALFVPAPPFPGLEEEFSIWFDLIAVFSFLLGGGNLLRVHLKKVARQERDWMFSLVTVLGFMLMLFLGLFKIGANDWSANYLASGTAFKWMYDAVFVPLQATIFSLLAFFVASAAFRAFRAKTREATILLIAAFIILIGRTPIGVMMTSWLPKSLEFFHIPNLSGWILSVPNMAGQRAVMIGIALGIISTSLKMILGIERSWLGGNDK